LRRSALTLVKIRPRAATAGGVGCQPIRSCLPDRAF
jgi:hypothetical protein